MRALMTAAIVVVALLPGSSFAQETAGSTAWQVEKCEIYQRNWLKALDFFGDDNLNYNFIAQNENFIESGCSAPPAVCPQSSQEFEIANALTIEMMNAGTASTFLPFRCEASVQPMSMQTTPDTASNAELCRSQLGLLIAGKKLLGNEAEVYEAQCACLELQDDSGTGTECAQ